MPATKKRKKKAEAGVKRARSAYNFFSSECVFANPYPRTPSRTFTQSPLWRAAAWRRTVRQLAVTQQGKSMAELSKLST